MNVTVTCIFIHYYHPVTQFQTKVRPSWSELKYVRKLIHLTANMKRWKDIRTTELKNVVNFLFYCIHLRLNTFASSLSSSLLLLLYLVVCEEDTFLMKILWCSGTETITSRMQLLYYNIMILLQIIASRQKNVLHRREFYMAKTRQANNNYRCILLIRTNMSWSRANTKSKE